MILSFEIKKTGDNVFDYLSDMQKFASVHPVITKIIKKGDNRYLVHETLKPGLIPVSFTYPVTVNAYPDQNIIIMRATVMKLTKIEMTFSLRASVDCTIVQENISFKSPWPVRFVLQRVFKKQHMQLFKNIEQAL